MRVAIVGCGRMGTAIAYAMHKLGYDLILVDSDADKLKACHTRLSDFGFNIHYTASDLTEVAETDIVISSATYTANAMLAKKCLERAWPYCDLGGDTETTHKIQDLANIHWHIGDKSEPIFTDLGLAPGLANIMAESMAEQTPPKSVIIRVGGLPVKPEGTLMYSVSWSLDGLRNEYSEECEILKDGHVVTVPALSNLEYLEAGIDYRKEEFPGIDCLETFPTKGGIGSSLYTMMGRGAQNCEYRTMRFPGHASIINFMLNECKMEPAEFNKAIESACPSTWEDQVLIAVDVDQRKKRIRILGDETWTAMQKSTAFPMAAVASLIAEKLTPQKPILDYADIPIDKMAEKLAMIGGLPEIF